MGLGSKIKKGWNKLRTNIGKVEKPLEDKVAKITGSRGIAKAALSFPSPANLGVVAIAKRPSESIEDEKPVEEEGIDLSGVEEALAMMAEYQAKALEAATREEPAAEPLKASQEAYDAAQADTNRLQLMRRGLMSTFTRYGGGLGGTTQMLGV